MKVAVVGATGLVGRKMIQVLEERRFPVSELLPVASINSSGKKLKFQGKQWTVISPEMAVEHAPDVAIFSAGGDLSRLWAPIFADRGTMVIDNSSAWRMDPNVPLVVPEINSSRLSKESRIIANPNCSTIQLVMVLAPLHKKYGIRRVIVSTYQSVSGTGKKAVEQLANERNGSTGTMEYPHPIHNNCIPQCDQFLDNGYTREEMKLVDESRKIMEEPELRITATAVRVPVLGGHSEAVNIEFNNDFNMGELKGLLEAAPGVTIQDDPASSLYPMPILSEEKDDVFVGRIRRDESQANGLNLWIVSDNLRKGAATNAIQIAEVLLSKGFIGSSQ